MRSLLFLLAMPLIMYSSDVYAQSKEVKVFVFDKESNIPLFDVDIRNKQNHQFLGKTKIDGWVIINKPQDPATLVKFRSRGYKKEFYTVSQLDSMKWVVRLRPKSKKK